MHIRKIEIVAIAIIHFIIINFLIDRLEFSNLISRVSKWPKLLTLKNKNDFDIALRVCRKVSKVFSNNRACLKSSLVLFWLGHAGVELHFSVFKTDPDSSKIYNHSAHSWVVDKQIIYSTDSTKPHDSLHFFIKTAFE